MSDFPVLGIDLDEIDGEIERVYKNFMYNSRLVNLYHDVHEDIRQAALSTQGVKRDLAEIISQNLGEYYRRIIEIGKSQAMLRLLFELRDKYFPDSPMDFTDNSRLLEMMHQNQDSQASSEDGLINRVKASFRQTLIAYNSEWNQ
jgi:hypothetical protein